MKRVKKLQNINLFSYLLAIGMISVLLLIIGKAAGFSTPVGVTKVDSIQSNQSLQLNPNIEPITEFPKQSLIISDPGDFISVWDTSKSSSDNTYTSDSSDSDQIRLPLESSGIYNFSIEWGDGNHDSITSWNQVEVTHTYALEGIYTISINGTIIGWSFDDFGDKWKILEIQQWGCLQLGNSGGYFSGCINLDIITSDLLNLTGTTSFTHAFSSCYSLEGPDNIKDWDMSKVTDTIAMFHQAMLFNQPVGVWNVSSVTDMSGMFWTANHFNQPIGNWDVSSVTKMGGMFVGANSFNQPIGDWDVSSVTDMSDMFRQAASFNQPIGDWDVSSVTTMKDMFYAFLAHTSFNQPIGNWDVSSVTDMGWMFYKSEVFDQNLGSWDVSNVEDMSDMFAEVKLSTSNYNALLKGWSQLTLQHNVRFHGGSSQYTRAAKDARENIISSFSWTIIDGGITLFVPGYNIGILVAILGLMGILFIHQYKKKSYLASTS